MENLTYKHRSAKERVLELTDLAKNKSLVSTRVELEAYHLRDYRHERRCQLVSKEPNSQFSYIYTPTFFSALHDIGTEIEEIIPIRILKRGPVAFDFIPAASHKGIAQADDKIPLALLEAKHGANIYGSDTNVIVLSTLSNSKAVDFQTPRKPIPDEALPFARKWIRDKGFVITSEINISVFHTDMRGIFIDSVAYVVK